MSVPATYRKSSDCQSIPSKRILINDASQLPADYSSTPGGTIFSTTPGGTKIIYDRNFLLQMRNSPLSKTPPTNLPKIPGVTSPSQKKHSPSNKKIHIKVEKPPPPPPRKKSPDAVGDEPQFEMDI